MSCSLKGPLNPMWRNAKAKGTCQTCGVEFLYYKGSSEGKYCSRTCVINNDGWRLSQSRKRIGKKLSEKARRHLSSVRRGVKFSESHKKALGDATRKRFEGHVSCRSIYEQIRTSPAYFLWKRKVFERDGCICRDCGSKPSKIDAHHIFPFSILVQEYLLNLIKESDIHQIDNGVTLCRPCHKKRHATSRPIEMRLFKAIQKQWKEEERKEPFEDYYRRALETFIEHVKKKLPPK